MHSVALSSVNFTPASLQSGGMLPRKKNRNLSSSNCWECIEIVNPNIATLFPIIFSSFTVSSGGPFWLLGGACAPRAPPCLRACQQINYSGREAPSLGFGSGSSCSRRTHAFCNLGLVTCQNNMAASAGQSCCFELLVFE